jgi:hypothetical protein
MAQDEVNFPFDQEKTSALRGLVQSRQEVAKPRRLDDAEEDLRNPGRAREAAAEEERDVSRPERIKDRVEITQDAFDKNQVAERNRAETLTAEAQQATAQQKVDQQEEIQGQAVAERRIESEDALQRNRTEPSPNNSQSAQVSGPRDSDSEEAAAVTNESDSNPTSLARKTRNETRDTGNEIADTPELQNLQLQQRVEADNAEIRGTEEVEIQEAARNEPLLDTPESYVEQIEEVRDPLQEAKDTNRLRAPRPSEIRDEPNATAIETERGQNVSNLI